MPIVVGRRSSVRGHDDVLRKEKHADLRQHCADLEERLRVYAIAINLLALENAAAIDHGSRAPVIPMPWLGRPSSTAADSASANTR
ncbi:hypothetical protein ACFUJU_19850 [Streptomyces sp. NPDC057235]|uniref:hypothetical protein n=1 Tax=Streptomyces sp. NPDC057235 TaxID=3346058 RepID=UPI0036427197